MTALTCAEICAGAGGQALGLEQAGIGHAAAVEIDADARETLMGTGGSPVPGELPGAGGL
ncbi:MAG TPA: DNA cytosine methyltransferase [Streptosporangiaceae bacterium]|nr:DNA cytosine methyltransferase [Streptosporangiaceae bacterium]